MRPWWIIVLIGCQGERVVAATDASSTDAGDNVCAIANNLVNNGDFALGAGGWTNAGFGVEVIAGPCMTGQALRLNSAGYADLQQSVSAPSLKQGTRFHLRAMFRDIGREGGNTPAVIARFFHSGDGGAEEYTQTITAESFGSEKWHVVESAGTLERDEESVRVFVLSRTAGADAFEVAAVSLVVE